MILSFFIIFKIESGWSNSHTFPDLYKTFEINMGSILIWLTFLLALGQVSVGELVWKYA